MRHSKVASASLRAATLAVGIVGFVGATIAVSAPAQAAPLPKGVRLQCTSFSGPNRSFPHPIGGCTKRNGSTGAGQSEIVNGTETIIWFLPFLGGRTMQLVNLANAPVSPPSGQCPSDHPVEVNFSGTIKYTAWGGSAVNATICANVTDFVLKPGSLFTISKAKGDNSPDRATDEP